MTFWMKILMFPHARKRVDADLIPKFAKIIAIDLKQVPAISALKLHEPLALRLAQECIQRAAESDTEGIPRYGVVYDMCDSIGDRTARLCRGEDISDPSLARILEFNGVQLPKQEPNQSSQRTSLTRRG